MLWYNGQNPLGNYSWGGGGSFKKLKKITDKFVNREYTHGHFQNCLGICGPLAQQSLKRVFNNFLFFSEELISTVCTSKTEDALKL